MLRALRNPRLLGALALVLVLLLLALWPRAAVVDLARVERGTLQVTVDEEGETRVRERFAITAPVAGRVLRVEWEPGDAVERGGAVATLLPAPLDPRSRAEARAGVAAAEAAWHGAEAEKRRSEAALRLARAELERHRALFDQQIVSRQQLDAREVEARAAEEALQAAEAAEARARYQLEAARARLIAAGPAAGAPAAVPAVVIRAPIDGVVLRRHRESEGVVAPGEPLLELGDPRQLEIVSDLLSSDAVKVRPGQAVHIEQWGGEAPLSGRVRRVEPSGFMKLSALGVEEQRVNVIVDFGDPAAAWKALGDGYRVEVRIVVWQAGDVLKVPAMSLFRRGEAWAVFVVDGGRARLRVVELGQRNGLEAQVLSGLAAGDQLVVHPGDALADGARVRPRSE